MSPESRANAQPLPHRLAALLLNELATVSAECIEIRYTGRQASGLTWELAVSPGTVSLKGRTFNFSAPLGGADGADDGGNSSFFSSPQLQQLSLDKALQAFVMLWIASRHPRWADDDGCEGVCRIDVNQRSLVLDHDVIVIDSYHYLLQA